MKDNAPAANESSGMTIEELQSELQSVKSELSSTKEQLQSVKNEFHNYRKAVSKKFSGHEDELEELEARFEEDEPTGKTSKDQSNGDELLPIERIARLKESDEPTEGDNPFADTTPSVDRAVAIYEHFRKWSSKAKAGRVIQENLRKLLNTATGESLAWKQVYRACQKLEEYSKGSIEFIQHDRHGWILVQERASSVGTGG